MAARSSRYAFSAMRQVFMGLGVVVVLVATVVDVVGNVVVVESANAATGALSPNVAAIASTVTLRVVKLFMWTPFKGTTSTVRTHFLKVL